MSAAPDAAKPADDESRLPVLRVRVVHPVEIDGLKLEPGWCRAEIGGYRLKSLLQTGDLELVLVPDRE